MTLLGRRTIVREITEFEPIALPPDLSLGHARDVVAYAYAVDRQVDDLLNAYDGRRRLAVQRRARAVLVDEARSELRNAEVSLAVAERRWFDVGKDDDAAEWQAARLAWHDARAKVWKLTTDRLAGSLYAPSRPDEVSRDVEARIADLQREHWSRIVEWCDGALASAGLLPEGSSVREACQRLAGPGATGRAAAADRDARDTRLIERSAHAQDLRTEPPGLMDDDERERYNAGLKRVMNEDAERLRRENEQPASDGAPSTPGQRR